MKWKKRTRQSKQTDAHGDTRSAALYNLPLLLVIATMVLVPVVGTIVTSLYRDVGFMGREFSFPDNYLRLFADSRFWQAMQFTLLFTVLSVVLEVALGLLSALLLNESLPGRNGLRVLLLLPWAIPTAVSARVWELMYNYEFGVLNFVLVVSGLTAQPVNWLGTPVGAFTAVMVADIWRMTPFVTIILLAGLSAIPPEVHRQALVDGANLHQRLARVTLPLLKPALVVAVLFRTIDAIRLFDLPYVLTGGGPGGSTTSVSLYAYNFYLAGDMGYGSAVSVVVFVIAFLLALVYIRAGRFQESVA